MIGLLRKDMYAVGWLALLMLPLALAISLLPRMENMGSIYPMSVPFLVALYASSYDERCQWDRYAAMLPYRVEHIVWEKYILIYINIVLAEATAFLSGLLRDLLRPSSVDWIWTSKVSVILLTVMLFIATIEIPTLYRFGAEKGRLVVCLILVMGLGVALAEYEILVGAQLLPPSIMFAALAALAVSGTFVSVRVSIHLYKKRRDGAYEE